MPDVVVLDTESYYDNEVSVKPLGYWQYARHPQCEKFCISVCDGKEVWAGHPRDFNFDSLNGVILLSHNAAHDQEIAHAAWEAGEWPRFKPLEWHCTANMAAYLWNVRSLKDAAKVGLGVDVNKGTRDKAKGKHYLDIVREGWWSEMVGYAGGDAQHPWHLWEKYSHLWPEMERWLSWHTIESGRHGVAIDIPALEEGIALMKRVILNAELNLPWVARGRKPGSPIGVAEECRTVGIPCPPVKADDPDAAEAWEDEYAPKFPFVRALKNMRKAKKALATLETIQRRLRPDGTVATNLKYCGAHTRRWAGDGGWNLQNPNRDPLFVDAALSFVYDKFDIEKLKKEFKAQPKATGQLPSGKLFLDLRGIIIARLGKKLAPVDLSQIEPRVLNWFAGNEKLLAMLREGMAIYEAFARDSLGWTGGKLKVEDEKLYSLAKADVLGLGYGAAWEKFITVAWTMAQVDITEGDQDFALRMAIDGRVHKRIRIQGKWHYRSAPENVEALLAPEGSLGEEQDCVFVRKQRKNYKTGELYHVVVALSVYGMRSRVTVEAFRQTNPLIVALWKNLDEAFKASLGEDFVLQGPNGDKLTYRNVKKGKRKKVDPDSEEEYEQQVFTAEVGGKRKGFYGGKLTENLVQWTARHVFAERMRALQEKLWTEDPSQWVLFTVHDEAVPEINDPGSPEACKARAKEIEAVFSVTPDWLPGCPIGAECKVLNRYAK
jgi:hypothetical protein